MNSNSTITSSVSHVLFKRDYLTIVSFMKRCGNKLVTKRHKYVVCNETRETHYDCKKYRIMYSTHVSNFAVPYQIV